MTIIEKQPLLTLINVFTVDPVHQDELMTLLTVATEQTMKHLPGFISANIHRSLDGGKVVKNAQWESKSAFEAMRANSDAISHMKAPTALAKFEPIFCEVVEAITR